MLSYDDAYGDAKPAISAAADLEACGGELLRVADGRIMVVNDARDMIRHSAGLMVLGSLNCNAAEPSACATLVVSFSIKTFVILNILCIFAPNSVSR